LLMTSARSGMCAKSDWDPGQVKVGRSFRLEMLPTRPPPVKAPPTVVTAILVAVTAASACAAVAVWMAARVLLSPSSKCKGFFMEASTGTTTAIRGSVSRSAAEHRSRGTTKHPVVPAPTARKLVMWWSSKGWEVNPPKADKPMVWLITSMKGRVTAQSGSSEARASSRRCALGSSMEIFMAATASVPSRAPRHCLKASSTAKAVNGDSDRVEFRDSTVAVVIASTAFEASVPSSTGEMTVTSFWRRTAGLFGVERAGRAMGPSEPTAGVEIATEGGEMLTPGEEGAVSFVAVGAFVWIFSGAVAPVDSVEVDGESEREWELEEDELEEGRPEEMEEEEEEAAEEEVEEDEGEEEEEESDLLAGAAESPGLVAPVRVVSISFVVSGPFGSSSEGLVRGCSMFSPTAFKASTSVSASSSSLPPG